jgi:hypothetical protein
MLLLPIELCKGEEHACDLLTVSVSMSIQDCEKTGSTPGYYSHADPGIIEIRRYHLTVPCHAIRPSKLEANSNCKSSLCRMQTLR